MPRRVEHFGERRGGASEGQEGEQKAAAGLLGQQSGPAAGMAEEGVPAHLSAGHLPPGLLPGHALLRSGHLHPGRVGHLPECAMGVAPSPVGLVGRPTSL